DASIVQPHGRALDDFVLRRRGRRGRCGARDRRRARARRGGRDLRGGGFFFGFGLGGGVGGRIELRVARRVDNAGVDPSGARGRAGDRLERDEPNNAEHRKQARAHRTSTIHEFQRLPRRIAPRTQRRSATPISREIASTARYARAKAIPTTGASARETGGIRVPTATAIAIAPATRAAEAIGTNDPA